MHAVHGKVDRRQNHAGHPAASTGSTPACSNGALSVTRVVSGLRRWG